jgi:hypothetical protein
MNGLEYHTSWCAGGHHCAVLLGEHRADPIPIRVPGAGTAVLTRVREATGTEYAEIRMRITLPGTAPRARARLAALLTHLRTLIGPRRQAP